MPYIYRIVILLLFIPVSLIFSQHASDKSRTEGKKAEQKKAEVKKAEQGSARLNNTDQNITVQNTIAVVKDSLSGEPVGNAVIMTTDELTGTLTAENGTFSLSHFEPGDTIKITHLAYRTKLVAIGSLRQNPVVLISPETINKEDVIITGSRYKVKNTAFSETFELGEAEKLDYMNVGDILKTKTSLHVKDYGGFSGLKLVSSRGMSSENTAVLFNETRVNDLRTGIFDFSAINPASIEKIEFIKGADEGNSQSAPGGTVSLTTGNFSERPSAGMTLKASSDETRSLQLSYKSSMKDFFYNLSAERTYSSNKFRYTFLEKDYERTNAHFSRTNFAGDFLYRQKLYQLKLYSGYNYLNSGIPGYVVSNNNNSSRALNISRSFVTILNGSLNPLEGLDIHSNLSYNHQLLTIVDPDNVLYYENRKKESGLTDFIYSLKAAFSRFGLSLSAGFEANSSRLENFTTYINNPSINAPIKRNAYRLFTTARYRALQPVEQLSSVTLAASAGYDNMTETIRGRSTQDAFSYSVGLSIIPNTKPYLNLKINAARNVRFPTFNERYYSNLFTENNLQKESYLWFDAGFESGFDLYGKTTFSLTYFTVDGRDKIIWVPTRLALQSPRNIQRVTSRGFELTVGREVIREYLKLSGTYNFTDARNKTRLSEKDMAFNKLLIYSPRHRFSFTLSSEAGPVTLSFSGNFASESFYTADNDRHSRLKEYFTADGSVVCKFRLLKKENRISLTAYNLFNQEYLVIQSYPMPLRTFLLTYNLEIL